MNNENNKNDEIKSEETMYSYTGSNIIQDSSQSNAPDRNLNNNTYSYTNQNG